MRLLFLEWDIDKARRRIERRTQRLYWLRDLFAEEISKVDPAFLKDYGKANSWRRTKNPLIRWGAIPCSQIKTIAIKIITNSSLPSTTCAKL